MSGLLLKALEARMQDFETPLQVHQDSGNHSLDKLHIRFGRN